MKNEMTKEPKLHKYLTVPKEKIWFVINTFFTIMYLCWRIFFTIPVEYGLISTIAGLALLIVEVLGMVEAMVHYANMSVVRKYDLPQISENKYPDVDIFISTYNEEVGLLYKTINGCKRMLYPDKSKVHIYLCDDNRRPQMRELAERMGVVYLKRDNNDGAKAGNLNNALANSSSPYVVTFDADMIPQKEFLLKTIPYFVDAELRNKDKKEKDKIKLGFVQTPQAFYTPDLFQFNLYSERVIPNEQDYFYKDIQRSRTSTNSVIYGGTNTVIAREALEKIGGFYTKSITEDFATGMLIQKAGYVSLGVDDALASGMSVTDLPGLIKQRIRWGRGVISTLRNMNIYTSKELSFGQKINYWASMWYWYAPFKRLIYIMSPLLYAVFGITVVKCDLPQVLLFWLPMFITSSISLNMLSGNIRDSKWTGIYETILFPFMLVPILLESFGISQIKFNVTEKNSRQGSKGNNLRYKLPFIVLIVLSVVGLIRCIFLVIQNHTLGPIVVIFWIVYNLYLLIMSLFFADGREERRKHERVRLSLPCTIYYKDYEILGYTRNVAEGGVSILLDKPYYFPEGSKMKVVFEDDRDGNKIYPTVLAEVVYSNRMDNKWNYSMFIHNYNGSENAAYNGYLEMQSDKGPLFAEGSNIKVWLESGENNAVASAEIVSSKRVDDMWHYGMFVKGTTDTYNEYLQMLYDRDPIFPEEIHKDNNALRDLKRNTKQRAVVYIEQKREYPQVLIGSMVDYVVKEDELESKNATKKVYVADYNFCYIRVKSIDSPLPNKLWMKPTENCYLQCEFDKTLPDRMLLYKVVNIDEISTDKEKMEQLQDWMEACHDNAEARTVFK